jgi:hypothetical protein
VAASKADQVFAEALRRVVLRSMFAGRSLAYDQLLAELAVEAEDLLDGRREREARLAGRVRRRVREVEVRLAAAAESDVFRAAVAEATSDMRDLLVRQQETIAARLAEQQRLIDIIAGEPDPSAVSPQGLPSWHPEHPENDF